MLRIPAKELALAAEALRIAAAAAWDCSGFKVVWEIEDPRKLEQAVLVALSALGLATGMPGPITPSAEYYVVMRKEKNFSWPPSKEELDSTSLLLYEESNGDTP